MKVKNFSLPIVLTVTTGRLLTNPKNGGNGIEDLYEILNWMTQDNLFTHQLPRASRECKPHLIQRFPELEKYGSVEALAALDTLLVNHDAQEAIEAWLKAMAFIGGKDSYDVPRLPRDRHNQIDPLFELVQMVGPEKVVVVKAP